MSRTLRALALLLFTAGGLSGQAPPTPEGYFGFRLGADQRLADWTSLTGYYDRLARTSDRVRLDTLGMSTRGRPFVMLTYSSPANLARLDELRDIQMRLADPRTVSGPQELERLIANGRTVVLITHAIHSTEVGSSQVAARLAHRLATSDEPDVVEILDEVIVLQIPSLNPDGTEWVADWYAQNVGTEHEAAPLPWLYHFYVGHDNNRDWYAFTQDETRLAIEGAHNAWHPQIVHDIHQMGGSGARIFFPPYIDPVERNVDPGLVAAVNKLGTRMAARLVAEGKAGVVVNAIYDAFTPARAYQHYHGGARILSETASADLATPVVVPPERLGGGRGYDAATPSWNHPIPWEGGAWHLADILDYMESGALALLLDAARDREYWLENFYRINQRAVEGWESWPEAWVIPATSGNLANRTGLHYLLRVLVTGDVEVLRAREAFVADGRTFPEGSWLIPMHQPWAAFAQTLLERQEYPDLREYPGGPPRRPYDVTAHTLPLLLAVEAVPVDEEVEGTFDGPVGAPDEIYELPEALIGPEAPRIAIYKSWDEPMEAGWTRWMFDRHGLVYDTLQDADLRAGGLEARYDVILLQDQSPRSIVEGFSAARMPAPFAGGLGAQGTRALRDFVRNGGRLVAVEDATELVVDLFDLAVGNAVERLPAQEFYVPGSILRLDLADDPLTRGTSERTVSAWYWGSSRAFDVRDPTVRVEARYAEGNPLLSGWILGPEFLSGRAALVSADIGRGSVVLFGFQPNYRAQTVATWPLLFDALTVPRRSGDVPAAREASGSIRRTPDATPGGGA